MPDKDKSLFLEAMQDVVPIEQKPTQPQYDAEKINHAQKQLLRNVKRKLNRQQTSGNNSDNSIEIDHNQSIKSVGAFEKLHFFQAGLRPQDITKLKKGNCTIQSELDLHGLTLEQAEPKIMNFIEQSYSYEMRYIRIIHGKGYNSDEQQPILKNLVNQILRQNRVVIGFASAPEKDGGTGAVNIQLKKQH